MERWSHTLTQFMVLDGNMILIYLFMNLVITFLSYLWKESLKISLRESCWICTRIKNSIEMLQERHFGQNRLIDSFLSAHAEQSLVISCTWLEISTTNLCTNWEKQHCHPTCITYTMQMSLGWLLWIVLCRFWNYADELNLNQIRFNPWMHSTYETQ